MNSPHTVKILETERLEIRELDSAADAEFVFELLNTPKFLQFIGDRDVRSVEQAAAFIENKYRQSYRDHGFGLYTVCSKVDGTQLGMCGFVKRDMLPDPDLGFAFLPKYERKGFGLESAEAVLIYGRTELKMTRILAITSLDNDASGKLLEKLGFTYDETIESNGEQLKLFSSAAAR